MSGIAGCIATTGARDAATELEGMLRHMRRRGPDGIGTWCGEGAALAHCRLHTTPEAEAETQPLVTTDGRRVLVADARLDNRDELGAALGLSRHEIAACGDGTLILAAFEAWGEGCLEHLDGDYAFALWQLPERRLFLARDRVGNRPLYYRQDDRGLAFATDLAALVSASAATPPLDRQTFAERLAVQWSGSEATLWSGILRLPPAHALVLDARRRDRWCYWSPDYSAELHYAREEDYVAHYRELLSETLRRQSRCQVPLACEVSGGLDSSALFALAVQLQQEGKLQAPGLVGLSLDCSEDAAADEIAHVRELARHLDQPITEVRPAFPEPGWYLQRLREEAEFPEAPHNALMLPLLQRARDLQCRVILNGVGGDEWLWGSRRYYEEELAAGRWRELLRCFRSDLRECGPLAPWWLFRDGLVRRLPPRLQEGLRRLHRRGRRRDRWSGKPWLSSLTHELLGESARQRTGEYGLRGGQQELAAFLADGMRAWALEVGEHMYAARGLEARSPMNTAAMIRFAAALPERMKMRGRSHKYIHVQAMQGLLPESLRRRRDKAEFSFAYLPVLAELADFFRGQGNVPLPRAWVHDARLEQLYEAFVAEPRHAWRIAWLWHAWLAAALLDSQGAAVQNGRGS